MAVHKLVGKKLSLQKEKGVRKGRSWPPPARRLNTARREVAGLRVRAIREPKTGDIFAVV